MHVIGLMIAGALVGAGCSKLVGIDDFTIRDDAGFDAPADTPTDAPPFGSVNRYVKASNTGASDQFGRRLALSTDGSTLIVAAHAEDSIATGVDGNQLDETASAAGAVYVLVRGGDSWVQQAYLKASTTDASDQFGISVAVSADGNTVAVAANGEDSVATGIDGNQLDNTALSSGAVYVFVRTGTVWSQQAYIKASNTGASDGFGNGLALSGDGNTLAVGANTEDSIAINVDGNQLDNTASAAGAVYVFARSGVTWAQQAYVKASNTTAGDQFGISVALSEDGNTLAVGARLEDSNATGVGGDQANDLAADAGAAYVLSRNGTIWTHQAYIKATNTETTDNFGVQVSLSADGNTLAVSATLEDSAATGVDGDRMDNTALDAGAAFIYTRLAATWTPQAYLKASNSETLDQFGGSIALRADGDALAVGALLEDSSANGLGGDQTSNAAASAGAVYLFSRSGALWTQDHYLKATNSDGSDQFGSSVALAGTTFVAGALGEDGGAIGIDGDQTDNTSSSSGAVYVVE